VNREGAGDGAALIVSRAPGRENECTVRPNPPIVGYLVIAAAWLACVAAITMPTLIDVPTRVLDLVVLALASHQISRVIAKERIALPIRRMFTEADGETPRPGWRRAPAELVTCPYCASVWSATALAALQSRTVACVLAFAAVASLLHAWRDR
jgi:hypothetical protein